VTGGAATLPLHQRTGPAEADHIPRHHLRVAGEPWCDVTRGCGRGLAPITRLVLLDPARVFSLKRMSANGEVVKTDSRADVAAFPDVLLQTNGVVQILLQTSNFPTNGSVSVRVTPKYSGYFIVNASYANGDSMNATWIAPTSLPNGYCVLQAHATSP
jgi:hypothetical protein